MKTPPHIVLYVHDCMKTTGHSRAMIETLNNLDQSGIESLTIVCFRSDRPQDMFPDLASRCKIINIPGNFIRPFLFKMLWFQLAAFIHYLLCIPRTSKTISIGICVLHARLHNIQFVHRQWEKQYFRIQKLGPLAWLYKRILFLTFRMQEDFVYSRADVTLVCLSKFVQFFCQNQWNIPEERCLLAYSGVNLEGFSLDENGVRPSTGDYPELVTVDFNRPVGLFVGAWERKGLPLLLDKYMESGDQLIVVGRPETAFKIPKLTSNIYWIKHTDDIGTIYKIADYFIFPTLYEPFGLVLIEAAAMGLPIFTTSREVGASEVIGELEEVYLFDSPAAVMNPAPARLDGAHRMALRKSRMEKLDSLTWKKTARSWEKALTF